MSREHSVDFIHAVVGVCFSILSVFIVGGVQVCPRSKRLASCFLSRNDWNNMLNPGLQFLWRTIHESGADLFPPTDAAQHRDAVFKVLNHWCVKKDQLWESALELLLRRAPSLGLFLLAQDGLNANKHTHTCTRLEKAGGIFPYCLCSGCPRFHPTIGPLQSCYY